jgi:hypothetical protein
MAKLKVAKGAIVAIDGEVYTEGDSFEASDADAHSLIEDGRAEKATSKQDSSGSKRSSK